MANQKANGSRYSYASIDTAPGTDGYWCDSVSMSAKKTDALFFSQREDGVGVVTLQFKTPEAGSEWTDYATTLTFEEGARFRIDDMAAGVKWRAGIKEDTSADPTYTSGTIIVGLDW